MQIEITKQSEKDFRFLLSRLSHEIRNPVTLINSELQLMASSHPELCSYRQWDSLMDNLEYVKELLKKYNLYDFKNKYPSELSGGMRQRVALIRTLAVKPKILLLDEAFSALDYQTRIMVTEDIYSILRKEKITALIVTHDISEAISMSDRVLVLSKRPGTIKDIHKIDFEMENRTPINCRQSPKFSRYFDCLWKELGVDEK